MNEYVIRAALLTFLANTNNDPDSILVSEMGLDGGRAIIDVAHINGIMCGYEIKSDVDTLYRLSDQLEVYKNYFQKLNIVTTKTHLNKVREKYPSWIGLLLAYEIDGEVHIKQLRQPKLNRKTDKHEITSLLWRDEAKVILSSRGIKGISSAPRQKLWHQMANLCTEDELIAIVKATMKSRNSWQVVG